MTTRSDTLEAVRDVVRELVSDPVPADTSSVWAAVATWARVAESIADGRASDETVALVGERARTLLDSADLS